jgi:hypothetical protein
MKMAQNNRQFDAKIYQAVMKYLFLEGNWAKQIYYDMWVALDDKRLSYSQSRTELLGSEQDI